MSFGRVGITHCPSSFLRFSLCIYMMGGLSLSLSSPVLEYGKGNEKFYTPIKRTWELGLLLLYFLLCFCWYSGSEDDANGRSCFDMTLYDCMIYDIRIPTYLLRFYLSDHYLGLFGICKLIWIGSRHAHLLAMACTLFYLLRSMVRRKSGINRSVQASHYFCADVCSSWTLRTVTFLMRMSILDEI